MTTATVLTEPATRRPVRRIVSSLLPVVVCVAGGWLLWDTARWVGVLSDLPSSGSIVVGMITRLADGTLVGPLAETLTAFLVSLVVATALGVPIGMLVGRVRVADDALGVTFDLMRPIPAVALVPVAVVVLGLGLTMQVALVVYASLWPVIYNARYGAQHVDPLHVDAARLSGLNRLQMFFRIYLIEALPSIMTGVRLAAAVAVVLTIVTELVASGSGIGYYVSTSQDVGQMGSALSGVLLAAILGTVVNAGVRGLELWLTAWHIERQALA